MNNEAAKKLDKLLLKDRMKSARLWTIIGFCLVLFVLMLLGLSAKNQELVVGVATGAYTRLHDEGHSKYVMVKVPSKPQPVKVRLPKGQLVLKGAKVEVYEIETFLFGRDRYRFLKYVE
jgi:hypothetical protein